MFVLETKTLFEAYVNKKIFKYKIGQHMDAGAAGGASDCVFWFGFQLLWLAEFAELRTWIKAFRVCYYHYSQSSPNRDNTTWC